MMYFLILFFRGLAYWASLIRLPSLASDRASGGIAGSAVVVLAHNEPFLFTF